MGRLGRSLPFPGIPAPNRGLSRWSRPHPAPLPWLQPTLYLQHSKSRHMSSVVQPATATRTTAPNLAMAIIALAMGGVGIGVTEFTMMGLLKEVEQGLNISTPEAGHLISAYALGVVIGAPLLAAAGAKL